MHFIVIFYTGILSMTLWPALVAIYGIKMGLNASGIPLPAFFAPAPKVLTRAEKDERKMAEKEAENAALQKKIAELEHELGIGTKEIR